MKNKNNYFLIFILIGFNLLIGILSNYLLNTEDLLINFYSEQLAKEQLEQLLENQQKWAWLGYAILPLLILIRVSLVSFCLSIGLFFYDIENRS